MAVPPRGSEVPSLEHDRLDDPAPPVPRPLPDQGRRAGMTAFVLIAAALVAVALIALL